ncbi:MULTISPECIES: hypothetical protein [unclassified Pseudomonas]|uniref:hypothetical protein n=1 Tax=unclassified Pseudomonas TaxID=196821 RepID=UPI0021C8501E|nr:MULTISPECIES: hypothetical protein [unclassified Pseudomonas]MCU1732895.1 hypothetical protein [Pseudomonas sp. 20P_3.2_Bac4]MCU1742439.1 hypothetical protein [Pseudomonas sp. 20P_3.2_Bac5]
MPSSLEDQFHAAMLNIYESAARLKPPYRATRFLQMVQSSGGKNTADQLLASANPSQGFTELFLRGEDNLKLSVEYLVLQDRWRSLFTEEQLSIAHKRLRQVGVTPPATGGTD